MSTSNSRPEEPGNVNPLVSALRDKLPPILWRHMWPIYQRELGLPFTAATMTNKDSLGRGPRAQTLARRVFYECNDYLKWLATIPVTAAGRADKGGSDGR